MRDLIIHPIDINKSSKNSIYYEPYYDHVDGTIYLKYENNVAITIWHEMMHKLFYEEELFDGTPGERSHVWDGIAFELAYFLFESLICDRCKKYGCFVENINACSILNIH